MWQRGLTAGAISTELFTTCNGIWSGLVAERTRWTGTLLIQARRIAKPTYKIITLALITLWSITVTGGCHFHYHRGCFGLTIKDFLTDRFHSHSFYFVIWNIISWRWLNTGIGTWYFWFILLAIHTHIFYIIIFILILKNFKNFITTLF